MKENISFPSLPRVLLSLYMRPQFPGHPMLPIRGVQTGHTHRHQGGRYHLVADEDQLRSQGDCQASPPLFPKVLNHVPHPPLVRANSNKRPMRVKRLGLLEDKLKPLSFQKTRCLDKNPQLQGQAATIATEVIATGHMHNIQVYCQIHPANNFTQQPVQIAATATSTTANATTIPITDAVTPNYITPQKQQNSLMQNPRTSCLSSPDNVTTFRSLMPLTRMVTATLASADTSVWLHHACLASHTSK